MKRRYSPCLLWVSLLAALLFAILPWYISGPAVALCLLYIIIPALIFADWFWSDL